MSLCCVLPLTLSLLHPGIGGAGGHRGYPCGTTESNYQISFHLSQGTCDHLPGLTVSLLQSQIVISGSGRNFCSGLDTAYLTELLTSVESHGDGCPARTRDVLRTQIFHMQASLWLLLLEDNAKLSWRMNDCVILRPPSQKWSSANGQSLPQYKV